MEECEIEGCARPAFCKGMCRPCYDKDRYEKLKAGAPKCSYTRHKPKKVSRADAVAALIAAHPEEYKALLDGRELSVVPAMVEQDCTDCAVYHGGGHHCLHCGALPSRAIFDGTSFNPILVPADMTDERIAAACARGNQVIHSYTDPEDTEDDLAQAAQAVMAQEQEAERVLLQSRLDQLAEMLKTNVTTERAVIVCKLNKYYRKGDPRVREVILASGRKRGRPLPSLGERA